jgi:hypothetical protein
MTGSMLEKIKMWKYVLTEKKLGNSSAWIETNSRKALCQLVVPSGVYISLAIKAKKLLQLCSCYNRPIQLSPPDWEVKSWYCMWFQDTLANGFRCGTCLSQVNDAYSMETFNSQDYRNLFWKFPCCMWSFLALYYIEGWHAVRISKTRGPFFLNKQPMVCCLLEVQNWICTNIKCGNT